MTYKKNAKSANIYSCDFCIFQCSKMCDYVRHLTTRKHKILTNTYKQNADNIVYDCSCGKSYKHRQSLNNHKKKCIINITEEEELNNQSPNGDSNVLSIFTDMMNQNKELQHLLIVQQEQHKEELQQFQEETHKQMLELAQETNKVIHYNTNNNNTINNRFNMNFFLNEQCKDAMNLTDFLNNIQVSLEDVSNVGRLGYADGISRIIINALKDMDVYERPIHCSDIKREIMYIKDNDIWEKDDERKYKMKRVLKLISHKNVKRLLDWREAHPGWLVYDSKEEAECLRITNESMGGASDEENERLYKKMIRKIAHETLIDKNLVE